jgi:hypothetical protein
MSRKLLLHQTPVILRTGMIGPVVTLAGKAPASARFAIN